MVDVLIAERAEKELKKLPENIQDRIKDKILNEVSENPKRHLKQHKGSSKYITRVGDYRIAIDWEKNNDRLKIVGVGHRDDVYEKDFW